MKAINEQNKVFELIDFLHSKKDNIITGHYGVAFDYYNKKHLYHSLKPKHKFEDDTAYREAFKDAENAQAKYDKVLKTYNDRLSELSFELPYPYTYRYVFNEIFDKWENSTSNKDEAMKHLRECRNKFNDLQDEKIIYFLNASLPFCFFSDLCNTLKDRFETYIQPKYSGLSKALQDNLEGANDEVIESIIDKHKLPHGADKPQWKSNADGARFGKYVGLSYSQLRELFDNDVRANNLPKTNGIDRNDVIQHILMRYKVPRSKQE